MILAAIALLLLALLLVVAELFVPSHGLLTIFAALAALASIFFAYKSSPGLGFIFAVVIVIATPVIFYQAIKVYPKTAVGKRVLLDQPAPAASEPFKQEAAQLELLVGRQGTAMTTLRPSGMIEIEGRRIDALSESEIIPPGVPVEVIRVVGLKVFVKSV